MKKITNLLIITLLLAITLTLSPAISLAQAEITCEFDEIVQADDWLSKIAKKYYGDILAFPAIAEATNAKAATDDSYATITNVDLIEPGWKLCIPNQADAQARLGQATTTAAAAAIGPMADSVVHITLLHVNDIYEITPVSGGTEGGLARLATLRKQLVAQNPDTFMLLAGDLFSPSALGTAKIAGERLAGQQIVAVMNEVGLDFMTFGNHEFDLKEGQFYQRLEESDFTWFSSNVFDANQQPFPGVTKNHILTVSNRQGQQVKMGLFGVTLASNPKPYVTYTDPFAAAAEQVEALGGQVDILIALTHLAVTDDTRLAGQFPQIKLILGGHEHENMRVEPGPGLAPIYKADANARTAYIHDLFYNPETGELKIDSRLQPITAEIPDDPDVLATVNYWLNLGFAGFRESGFNPEQIVTQTPIPLDGLEVSVRNQPTELTKIIADSMLTAAPGTELAIFNGGSIRIDDVILPGAITEYDVIRVLPFGDQIKSVEMKGSLLKQTLDQGQNNAGKGGYLQTANVSAGTANNWLVNDIPLDPEQIYLVAINDFLLTGREEGLDFLTAENPELQVIQEHTDVRKALIEQLKLTFNDN